MIGKSDKSIVVFGATGKQGGAVIDALDHSADTWTVKAVTRNSDSDSAKDLRKRGVIPVAGDMNDPSSLIRALEGAYGVYSVQANFGEDKDGREVRYGKNIVDAAKQAQVSHLVFSSVGGAERKSGVPHFEAKRAIELHLIDSGVPFTILRPASFMDNFAQFAMRNVLLSMFKTIMSPATKLQLVATRDIGRFAAQAFEAPEAYKGKAIELAGDNLTVPEIIQTLKAGKVGPVLAFRLPKFIVNKLPEDFPIMVQWFEDHGFKANIHTLNTEGPKLWTLVDWIKQR